METDFAVEGVRPRAAYRADAAASVEYPRSVHLLLLSGFAGLQAAWLAVLCLLAYWLA